MSILIIGDDALAGRACLQLSKEGRTVIHLALPGDAELHRVLTDEVTDVAVLIHDDTAAIRYVLAIEHVRPGIDIFVALFDRTAGRQLRTVVPNVWVSSPADIALPSLIGPLLDQRLLAVGPRPDPNAGGNWPTPGGPSPRRWALRGSAPDLHVADFAVSEGIKRAGRIGRLRGQFRPHDGNSAILLTGLLGLLAILVLDAVLLVVVLHRGWLTAIQEAVAVLSTVGPTTEAEGHTWYQVFAIVAMLAAIVFLAVFTAGIVEHLLSGRYIGLFGRRVMPRSGHVVIVGLGQVGLRLCQELRSQGVAVVALERDSANRNLPIARAADIPVLIGDGGMRRTMVKLGVRRSIAVAAVASDELDNIAVSITARALAPGVPVVMRAGDHDAIAETSSLFRIGSVVDVNGLTVSAVADRFAGDRPVFVADAGEQIAIVEPDGSVVCRPKAGGAACPHFVRPST